MQNVPHGFTEFSSYNRPQPSHTNTEQSLLGRNRQHQASAAQDQIDGI